MDTIFRQPGKTGRKIKRTESSVGFATRKNCTISFDNTRAICNYNNVFFYLRG